MDDGAKNYDDSLKLCQLAAENSINAIVATPHFYDYNNVDKFVREREQKAQDLREMVEKEELDIGIGTGAEVFLSDGIYDIEDFTPLSINESRYVLCEYILKTFDPKYAVVYAEKIVRNGFVPIIAHPERYKTFIDNKWIVDELLNLGALLQVNAPSLAGKGGQTVKEYAEDLVLSGKTAILATDAHSPFARPNDYIECKENFNVSITDEMLNMLTRKNPYKIISDKQV